MSYGVSFWKEGEFVQHPDINLIIRVTKEGSIGHLYSYLLTQLDVFVLGLYKEPYGRQLSSFENSKKQPKDLKLVKIYY